MHSPRLSVLVVALMVVPAAASAASTQASWDAFDLSAAAAGTHLRATIPGGPLSDEPVDVSTPWAHTHLSSLGQSVASAAAVNPGDFALSVGGLARSAVEGATANADPDRRVLAALDGLPSWASLPVSVASSHPHASHSTTSAGPLTFTAESHHDRSEAAATSAGSPTITSTARVELRNDGSLFAGATTTVAGFVAGPVAITHLRSRAEMTWAPGRTPEQAHELEVDGVTIDGRSVAIEPGFSVTLEAVTVRYLEATPTDEGLMSPAVEITLRAPVAFADTSSGSVITYTLGRAAVMGTAQVGRSKGRAAAEGDSRPTSPGLDTARADVQLRSPAPITAQIQKTVAGQVLATGSHTSGGDRVPSVATAPAEPMALRWYEVLLAGGLTVFGALVWMVRRGVRGTWTYS